MGAAAALPLGAAAETKGKAIRPADNSAGHVEPFELDELSIADLQQAMQSGKESARSLVKKYQARIEAVDRKGPALNSVIEVNPDAIEIAEALDRERSAKGRAARCTEFPC